MKWLAVAACVAACATGFAYHEQSYGNNVNPAALGTGASQGAASREMVAVGYDAARDADKAIWDVFIGESAGKNSEDTLKAVGIGYNALGDAKQLRNVVAIGNYELGGLVGATNVTSINNGQLFVSQQHDVALIRPNSYAAPSNSPFAYIAGNTYIGGTGTTYIAGNVVFGGRAVVVDNKGGGGGSGTAHLAGSGDLADQSVPYSTADCQIFVSSRGSDSGDGTVVYPYLTLNRALRDAAGMISSRVVIGVMGGEYAYPSNALLRSVSSGTQLVVAGLEGSEKTSFTLAATGLDPEVIRADADINAYQDRAVIQGGHEDRWVVFAGFTFDGCTIATKSYSDASYSCARFTACRFKGDDATLPRRYNRMKFANCAFERCRFEEGLEFRFNDHNESDGTIDFISYAFFACDFFDCWMKNPTKYVTNDPTGAGGGGLMHGCGVRNCLFYDSTNAWRVVSLEYTVYEPKEDSAFYFERDSPHGLDGWPYSETHTPMRRTVVFIGANYAGRVPPRGYDIDQCFFEDAADAGEYVDANIYPLDTAYELFGMGYNNSLTRRFVDWVRSNDFATREWSQSAARIRDTAAPERKTVMLSEDGELNIYAVEQLPTARLLAASPASATAAEARSWRPKCVKRTLPKHEDEKED